MYRFRWKQVSFVAWLLLFPIASPGSLLIAPGDTLLRHDIQMLDDAGAINIPLNSWPSSTRSISSALAQVDRDGLSIAELAALHRIERRLHFVGGGRDFQLSVSAAANFEPVRTFESMPRDEAGITVGAFHHDAEFSLDLQARLATEPDDGERFRPDGSHLAYSVGNWILSAGWQDRWWGPGRDGSLILSTNTRPMPALAVQRDLPLPFQSRWLSWLGPWSLTSFVGFLDDERVIDDALLFGLRIAVRPFSSLEIGLSRSAQWCGNGRPCSGDTFIDLLLGRDNRNVNIGANEEPGNQLAGFDLRWRLPGDTPPAVYLQWIGEDTRRGGPEIGSWLRMIGIERGGTLFGMQHRTHIEIAETTCRRGGLGFSEAVADCGYEHSIYRSGYRYLGKPLGHPLDSDSLSYSLGSTLVQSAGQRWNATLRYSKINRLGSDSRAHSLSADGREQANIMVSHGRKTALGDVGLGLGWSQLRKRGGRSDDLQFFATWQFSWR